MIHTNHCKDSKSFIVFKLSLIGLIIKKMSKTFNLIKDRYFYVQ